jgi:hypothetical protein
MRAQNWLKRRSYLQYGAAAANFGLGLLLPLWKSRSEVAPMLIANAVILVAGEAIGGIADSALGRSVLDPEIENLARQADWRREAREEPAEPLTNLPVVQLGWAIYALIPLTLVLLGGWMTLDPWLW